MPRPPVLDSAAATALAAKAHAYVLDALMSESTWRCRDVAFHGGTSLHLSWHSPRHSEDLDFLVSRDVPDVAKVMRAVGRRVQERFALEDPSLVVEVKDKTRDPERMPNYQVVISSAAFTGRTMVKVEFWRVDRDYLARYPVEFRTPLLAGDMVSAVVNPIPAATLPTAFCDKLVAFATRPYLKWRDVFDLWWIGTQTRAPLDLEEVSRQFLHNVTAYDIRGGLAPADALREFLARDDGETLAEAERDLRQWLPEPLWNRLYPDTVERMVAYVRKALATVADHVEAQAVPDEPDVLKTGPR